MKPLQELLRLFRFVVFCFPYIFNSVLCASFMFITSVLCLTKLYGKLHYSIFFLLAVPSLGEIESDRVT